MVIFSKFNNRDVIFLSVNICRLIVGLGVILTDFQVLYNVMQKKKQIMKNKFKK